MKAFVPRPTNRRVLPGMSLAFGGIVVALFGKMVFHMDIVVLIGVLASIAGMFYIATYPYLPLALRFEPYIGPAANSDSVLPAGSTKKLPSMEPADAVPSVTEHTTNLLKVPVARREDR
ncbi:MAG: hypothetical protein ABJA02_02640 [Acidobacteriota bacterium]